MADRALIHKSTNQNRECGIVIKQTAEEPALPAATAPKTNPPAGMNQRADRETSRCLMAAARRPFVRGATAPGPVHCSACSPAFPCNSAVVIQCIWMQGEDPPPDSLIHLHMLMWLKESGNHVVLTLCDLGSCGYMKQGRRIDEM